MATFLVTNTPKGRNQFATFEEAVAAAEARKGADTITFDAPKAVILNETVSLSKDGGPLTINGDVNGDGVTDVVFYAFGDQHLTVGKGAKVTIVNADFASGGAAGGVGAYGTSGASGAAGTDGTEPPKDSSEPGGNGSDGSNGQQGTDARAGKSGAGAIINEGDLTLIRTGFGNNFYFGGDGGNGGSGGRGGNGGNGGQGAEGTQPIVGAGSNPAAQDSGDGGDGGRGGSGANGGRGGGGGDAAGAILNERGAELTIVDSVFGGRLTSGLMMDGNKAEGGNGGNGGFGGAGGNGGGGGNGPQDVRTGIQLNPDFWMSFESIVRIRDPNQPETGNATIDVPGITYYYDIYSTEAGAGGDGNFGGRGGNGGAHGNGGSAAGAILNRGALFGNAAITADNEAEAGTGFNPQFPGNRAGAGGLAGGGGLGGFEGPIYRLTETSVATGAYAGFQVIRRVSDIPADVEAGTDLQTPKPNGAAGLPGAGGADSVRGEDGKEDDAVVVSGGSGRVEDAATLVYAHGIGVDSEAGTLSFNIIRVGDISANLSLQWALRPASGPDAKVSASDFVGGMPKGRVTFEGVNAPLLRYELTSVETITIELTGRALTLMPKGYEFVLTGLTGTGPESAFGTNSISGVLQQDPLEVTRGTDRTDRNLRGDGDDNDLRGLRGNDRLFGLAGDDVLNGGAGNDQLVGGGGRDTFLFTERRSGQDRITDFNDRRDGDLLAFESDVVANFSALRRAAEDEGDNLVITLARGNSVTISDFSLSDLDRGDVIFL
jgi:hypothetical protein